MRRRKQNENSKGFESGTSLTDLCTTEDDERDDEPPKRVPVHESKVSFMGKVKKAAWRSLFGTIMMVTFGFIISCGHAYVCLMVFAMQTLIFKELVGVRQKMAAEKKIPLFRSVQWAWFFTASFYVWSDGMFAFIQGVDPWRPLAKFHDKYLVFILENSSLVSLGLYSGLLMVSILCLRKGLYRYQMTQYSWTLLTCCIVVFQMRAVFLTVYSGLFWFVLPCSLVICNDIMAYFSGVLLGKKLISRPFLELSPNKTWEGFIGGALFTLIFAWFFSRFLSGRLLMTCVPEHITLSLEPIHCDPPKHYTMRPIVYEGEQGAFPGGFRRSVGYILSFFTDTPPQASDAQCHALALALFASLVAPFGGFLASAIKRAYGIKDFAALIPGHGGLMDRMDCQFVMAMCTYVHLMTWCRVQAKPSVDGVLAAFAQLLPEERDEVIKQLGDKFAK
jgi:phosphatidate cytidylyltransferase